MQEGRQNVKLTEKTKSIIGEHNVERFNDFSKYNSGWDGKDAEPLKRGSVSTFNRFFAIINPSLCPELSIFLSSSGNLEAMWDNPIGGDIELGFLPNSIEYYFSSPNIEGSVFVVDIDSPLDLSFNRVNGINPVKNIIYV